MDDDGTLFCIENESECIHSSRFLLCVLVSFLTIIAAVHMVQAKALDAKMRRIYIGEMTTARH